MDDKIYKGYLLDFYGELLSEHQRETYEEFIVSDLSYSEIAEEMGISRQAVYDNIKRCDKLLKSYEEKLGLVEKFMHIRDKVTMLDELVDSLDIADFQKNSMRDAIADIYNIL